MYDQNELYHHGILGQRWGVRRFQNPDGTRTTAGKKRERESDEGSKKHIGRKIAIGVGAALAIGGAAYAISTGKVNVGSILQNFGSTPVSSVPKKPSEATLAVLDANKQYKTKMLLKKHETSRAIVAANKKMKEEAARKVAEEAAKRRAASEVSKRVTRPKTNAELIKDIGDLIEKNKSFKLGIINTNASLYEQADQFMSFYNTVVK